MSSIQIKIDRVECVFRGKICNNQSLCGSWKWLPRVPAVSGMNLCWILERSGNEQLRKPAARMKGTLRSEAGGSRTMTTDQLV